VSLDPEEHPTTGPVIRDKRRIDPTTGEVRASSQATTPPTAGQGSPEGEQNVTSDTMSVEAELAERTADLQRLQAEYVNYKRRVDRDKEHARQNAVASTLGTLLPVLDDIDRAREHGELTGGFKAVADSFQKAVEKIGLEAFGEIGDEFDPRIHDALMHSYSDEVTGPTCTAILQVGYRIGERVLRPARVAVAEPTVAVDVAADPAADTAIDLAEGQDDTASSQPVAGGAAERMSYAEDGNSEGNNGED
jgi:molecular chaperone GrpE